MNDEHTTLSISRARRILGRHSTHLSDNQVRDIIYALKLLAREQLGYNGSKKAE